MRVTHPNLFLNCAEIEAIREKIRRHEWAGHLYQRLRAQADDTLRGGHEYDLYYDRYAYPGTVAHLVWTTGRRVRDVALAAVISDEPRYADYVREVLSYYVDHFAGKPITLDSFTDGAGGINLCWAYDLAHDRFSEADREGVEDFLLRWARGAQGLLAERPAPHNISFWGRTFCGVVGYTTGDRDLIEFALEAPGGFKDVMEKGMRDGGIWREANAYHMSYVSSAMAALAEAALHGDGVNLYHWRSPNGSSMKGFYDACLALAFPVELRVTTHGNNSSQSPFVSHGETHTGHQIGDYFLANDRDGRDWNKYDLAYHRYRDPAYAWVLARNPARDAWDHSLWGYLALTHGAPLPERIDPPAAPSMVFMETGLAMLRADESPAYWTSGCPAVSVRFGQHAGHGHRDPFHITFHGRGRLLEPDWFRQWDYTNFENRRGGNSPTPFSIGPVGHNTLLVDKKPMEPLTQPLTVVEHEFGAAAKVIRISGSVYPGVEQTRTLALTGEYLLDLFEVRADEEHTYDWILHALGELSCPGPAFSPFDLGADLGFGVIDIRRPDGAENRWLRNGMRADTVEAWEATWWQGEDAAWGRKEGAGVRVTMIGAPGTTVYSAETPLYVSGSGPADEPADGKRRSIPLIIARRHGRNTVYIALHEPFDDLRAPQCRLRPIRASEGTLGVEVRSGGATDYFFYAASLPGPHPVESEVGTFQLNGGYGYLRKESRGTTTQGMMARP
ncbi:MAG: alginate lyase family protein [Armatimonadetes bacterium]|nr:alginate lyase family protein [Armatimonadota bacterium]